MILHRYIHLPRHFRIALTAISIAMLFGMTGTFQDTLAQSPTRQIDQRQERADAYVARSDVFEKLTVAQSFVPTVDNLTLIEFNTNANVQGVVTVSVHESTPDGIQLAAQTLEAV